VADTPPPTPKKKKGVPTWYYIAGAGALIVAYYAYAKSQANKAAASTSTAGSGGGVSAGTAAGSYGNAGDLAALAPYLNSTSAAASTSGASTTNSPFVLPSGENFIGSGYGFGPSAEGNGQLGNIIPSSTPATSISGASYIEVPQANIGALSGSGQQVYYQPAPGVFTPLPSGAGVGNLKGLVGTTPLFIQQQAAAA
jgi:hypothetical protein